MIVYDKINIYVCVNLRGLIVLQDFNKLALCYKHNSSKTSSRNRKTVSQHLIKTTPAHTPTHTGCKKKLALDFSVQPGEASRVLKNTKVSSH